MGAATPITVYDREECAGHVVTVFLAVSTGGGGTAVTCTLDAGLPSIDLSKAHPILCVLWIDESTDDMSANDAEGNANDEVARGTAPTVAGDFDIEGYMSFKLFQTTNADGIVMVTYWAAGCKQV